MNIKNFHEKYSYPYVNTLLLCGMVSLSANDLLRLELQPLFILLCLFFFTSLMVFIDAFKKKMILFIISIISLSLFLFIMEAASLSFFLILSEAFTWIFHSRDLEEVGALTNAVISTGFILAVLVAFTFKIIFYRQVRLVIGVVLFITTIVLAILQEPVGNLLIFLFFFYLLLIFHELILRKEKAITYLLPFVLVVALVIAILPSSNQRIHWGRLTEPTVEFFGRATRRISDFFPWGRSTEFEVNFIGYTEDGRLRGPIRRSEGEALQVTGIRPYAPLYLTGTIMDTYTGAGWERRQNMDHFDYHEMKLSTLELMLALYAHDALSSLHTLPLEEDEEEWISQWLEVRVLNIEFLHIRTRSIFHPLGTLSLTSIPRMDLTGSSLFFTRPKESSTSYTLHYLSVNYGHESFQELLLNANPKEWFNPSILEGVHPGEFFYYFSRIPGLSIPSFPIPSQLFEILAERRELIYYYYTFLPESIPERVFLLGKEITRDYSTNYEKMRAIEFFLANSHFTYTTTPPPIPAGDFVDWFIFEGTAGYCTYFATAAAILGRSVGIPVRYVQGFTIPATKEGRAIVSNRYAHAWVEAYMDHLGWIPFEPTPTFSGPRQDTWGDGRQLTGPFVNALQREDSNLHSRREPILESQREEAETLEEERVYLPILIGAFVILLVILLGLFFSWLFYFLRGKKKYLNASVEQRFRWLFKEILYLMELQGVSIPLGETLREFSAKMEVNEFFGEFGNKGFTQVVELHEKIVYEMKCLSLEELETVGKVRDHLVKRLKKKRLKVMYWFFVSR